MQLKYLVVDDEEISRLAVAHEASRFSFLEKVGFCSHALEAIEQIRHLKPDVLFADIEMPGISGTDMLRLIKDQVPILVFVTSHPEFALEGFELSAFDYLLKPLDSMRFERCALRIRDFFNLRDKAFQFDAMQEGDSIVIKQGYEKYRLYLSDILYVEAMRDYTRVLTEKRSYLVLESLGSLLQSLPADRFLRIHRSYAVNREKILAIKGNKLFVASAELPVGKIYKKVLNNSF